jgi:predicted DNA-binding protein (MmcQ/YjbR family)
MQLKALQRFCASLPHAVGERKWEVDFVYSLDKKMFAIACETAARGTFVCFKVDDERFLEYTDRDGFIPAPYLARAKWVQVTDLKKVSDAELRALITRSHALIAMKLSKKRRAELGLG